MRRSGRTGRTPVELGHEVLRRVNELDGALCRQRLVQEGVIHAEGCEAR